ncbi:kinesin-like protein KIF2A [Platysternon megacephalum]|uniref:Kinesin-like protein KIF2A n=1 Tax=Platysternon megacephalum TaxID=55544 RepID=A0A4D9FEB4_9SAUR|nr:kinesin-like protein KIF2A [Platysternon megacephalum]
MPYATCEHEFGICLAAHKTAGGFTLHAALLHLRRAPISRVTPSVRALRLLPAVVAAACFQCRAGGSGDGDALRTLPLQILIPHIPAAGDVCGKTVSSAAANGPLKWPFSYSPPGAQSACERTSSVMGSNSNTEHGKQRGRDGTGTAYVCPGDGSRRPGPLLWEQGGDGPSLPLQQARGAASAENEAEQSRPCTEAGRGAGSVEVRGCGARLPPPPSSSPRCGQQPPGSEACGEARGAWRRCRHGLRFPRPVRKAARAVAKEAGSDGGSGTAPEMMPMILTVFLSNNEQILTEVPITPETTCRDVVEFCKEPGEGSCHLAEVWRGNDSLQP